MKTTFGEYIRKLRTEKGLTLTQLAYKLDLDSANLSKIENGKRDFDKKRLPKLAETFELDLKELNNEFVSDLIAKQIYESNCSSELLLVAVQKADYRRKTNQNKIEKAV